MLSDPVSRAAIISGVISFLFGGGSIAYLKFWRDGRAENRTFAESEREKMRLEIDRLTQAVSALSARLVPSNLPTWIKDANRKYIDVNPAWEIQIGTRVKKYRVDIIGKTDEQIFDEFPEFAQKMVELDAAASMAGGLAVTTGLEFPMSIGKRLVIKEIVVHDILGQPIFKGIAIPETAIK